MKRVVGRKIYNTETAVLLHENDNGRYYEDYEYCEEALYQTGKGAYFLATEKGSGFKGIEVMTEAQAIQWLEDNGGTAALVSYFSDKLEAA